MFHTDFKYFIKYKLFKEVETTNERRVLKWGKEKGVRKRRKDGWGVWVREFPRQRHLFKRGEMVTHQLHLNQYRNLHQFLLPVQSKEQKYLKWQK